MNGHGAQFADTPAHHSGTHSVCSWLTVVVLGLALAGPAACAEHEADHRYDLVGYVIDANGEPVANREISVRVNARRIGGGRSDAGGRFGIRLHLHDADLGRELEVEAGGASGPLRVDLTPGDTSTHRIHHVNFVGGRLVEGKLERGLPGWVYVAALAGALLTGLFAVGAHLRLRRRAVTRRVSDAHPVERRAPRDGKRGKRKRAKAGKGSG